MLASMKAREKEYEEFLSDQDNQVWNFFRRMTAVPEGKRRKPSRVIQDVFNNSTSHPGDSWD